ncbi:hypothetical protein GCM10023339_29790 [Alloalcanivorax gelatiniphagus]
MRRSSLSGVVLLALVGAGAAPATAAPVAPGPPPTSTTLTLSTNVSAYGQTVRATAAVVSPAGPAEGDVVFSVDGTAVKANLTGGGTASLLLPEVAVGDHTVAATFVPQFPDRQEGSASPSAVWRVAPAAVDLRLRVSGARPRAVARVHTSALGDFGTVPTGTVRLRLFRGGPRARTTRTAVLSAGGGAVTRLGRLAAGRYRVEAAYPGDTQHQPATRVVRFRVP